MSLSKCMSVVERLSDQDQDALLARADRLQAEGMSPNKAALQAAIDMMAELQKQAAPSVARSAARDVTQTEEFKRWFSDSKVVDADGKPLVVYHGTRRDFSEFRTGPTYFTADAEMANVFTMDVAGSSVIPSYLRITNPFVTRDAQLVDDVGYDSRAVKMLQDAGHDGVIYRGRGGKKSQYIAFRPEQIKSATGNRGTFDPADPDITRSADRSDMMGDPPEAEQRVVQDGIQGRTLSEAVKFVHQHAPSKAHRVVAETVLRRLGELQREGVRFNLNVAHVGDTIPRALASARGITHWQPGLATDVWINGSDVRGKSGMSFEVVLHEAVHAATMASIQIGNLRTAAGTELGRDVSDLYTVSNTIVRHLNKRFIDAANKQTTLTDFEQRIYQGASNAFRDPHEVISWALTNPEAQAYLEGIQYRGQQSLWDAFVGAVRVALGLRARHDTALSEVLRISGGLMSGPVGDLSAVAQASGTAMQQSAGLQIDTPEFKRWFGDSKVVGADGKPQVVYHGTFDDFGEFSRTSDLGFHVGTALAANDRLKQEGKRARNRGRTPSVMPLYASINNPVDISDQITWTAIGIAKALQEQGIISQDEANPVMKSTVPQAGERAHLAFHDYLVDLLKSKGYDGVRYINLVEGARRAKDGDVARVLETAANDTIPAPAGKEFVARYRDSKYPVGAGSTEAEAMANAEKRMRREKRGLDYSYIAFDAEQIKSATGNSGAFDPADADITRSATRPEFFSQLELAVTSVPAKIATMAAPQWKLWLDANAAKLGVKKDEIEWSGIRDYLDLQGKDKVSSEQLQAYLSDNGVRVRETVLGNRLQVQPLGNWWVVTDGDNEVAPPFMNEKDARNYAKENGGDPVKYGTYTVPGGENYREVLITLPSDGDEDGPAVQRLRAAKTEEEYNAARSEIDKARAQQYKSSHWNGQHSNILAHLRLDDRTDADGNKVLFINEIQSDAGQDKRKGKTDWKAPFIDDTKAWASLALKRAIMMAVEGGYDRVALITGHQAADLYDLIKQVNKVLWTTTNDTHPNGIIYAYDHNGKEVMNRDASPDELPDLVGKDVAEKLLKAEPFKSKPTSSTTQRSLEGLDLNVGGEGMRAFYDQIIPQVARDVLKKLGGGSLTTATITEDPNVALDKWEAEDGEGDGSRAPTTTSKNIAFDITPAMREKVEAGVPLFSKRRPDPIETAENFKRWSNGAPLVTAAQADDHAFRTGEKVVLEAYHGTARGDRVGEVFQRARATSGPMAYFTSDPALASSYATGKRDTSMSEEELRYTSWFKYKGPGMRAAVDLERAWHHLPDDVKQRVAERMPDIRTNDDDEIIYEAGGGDIGSYQHELQRTSSSFNRRGNPLKAAAETWLNSGTLFGEEQRFMDVLRLAGMPMKDMQYDSPHDSFPFVYKVFLRMDNPLVTSDIPESFDQALRLAAAKDRSRAKYENGVDGWDKNTRTLKQWASDYFNPPVTDNRYVWTSIPDKVSALLKSLGYDGVIDYSGKAGGDVHPVYIPMAEEQVKSAIGNNGKFGEVRNILRSADRTPSLPRDLDGVRLAGGYTLGDLMKSSKKVSWWDKSVGSMFNLAEKQPEFKRVYDEVQHFIGDISKYGTRAADMAPTIIPKLETLKDIARRPLSVEDTKALSGPVFEGTLMFTRDEEGNAVRTGDVGAAGVVWRDEELRDRYGMNDHQIGLYRETRRAINKSLTDLGITDMLRYAGKDADGVRDAVLSSSTANHAAQILAQEFDRIAEETPERAEALADAKRGVLEKANMVHGLIAKGYAPLSRYGDYTVYVTKDGGKEQVFFGMYETEREANRAARAWSEAEPDASVNTGTMSKEGYKLFKGVTPETLALFGESLGLEESATDRESQVFQAYLKAAKTNRSAMKRMIERKGVSGYSEDVGRVLAGFVYSNARQSSTNLHAGAISKAAADIKDGDLKDQAIKLVEYTQTPKDEANALRGLMFANFIGGSIASALVNTTQTATTTLPALAMHFGTAKAAKGLAKAIDNVRKGGGDDDLKAAMKRAEAEGITAPQEVHHLMAQASGRSSLAAGDGTKVGNAIAKIGNAKNKAMLAWGSLFGWAEQLNRRIAFAAGYQMARDGGMADPFKFAEKLVAQTQFTMNAGNNPVWARGAVGATLFTFKKFGFAYLELLARMLGNGPEGKRAFALALGVLFLLAGTGGFPFAEDLDDLIDGFAQRVLNKSFSSKAAKKEFFASVFGNDFGDFLEGGLSSLPGAPIDVSGRLGLGNIIPGTGVLTIKQDYSRDVAEVGGAAASFVQNWLKAAGMLANGDVANAAATASPLALANVAKAIDMANMGMYRDQRGRKVIDTTLTEAVLKGIGFQPATVKKVQEASGIQQSLIAQNKIRETEIADLWAKGRIERRPDLVDEAKRQLEDWNKSNPESRISIDPGQINKRVQAAMQDKAKRIEKTAPKEIRQAVKAELEAAR